MKIVLDVIGTIGGIGTLIAALSGFLSRVWADSFMKKKTAEYDKQIQKYKNDLEITKEKYKAFNEESVYKKQRIFDRELNVYQEILPILIRTGEEAITSIINVELDIETQFNKAWDVLHDFQNSLFKNAVFVDVNIFNEIKKYCQDCYDCLESTRDTKKYYKDKFMINDVMEFRKNLIENSKYLDMVIAYQKIISNGSQQLHNRIREHIRNMEDLS